MKDTVQLELTVAERHTPLILVVDDDQVMRLMLRKALETEGYEIIEASNGVAGVELFKECRPDLVLLDIVMPVMNGFDACSQMRESDPSNITPITILTGNDDIISIDKAFSHGATDFITKPVNWELFNQRIKYVLHAKHMDIALRESQYKIQHALKVAKLGYWDLDFSNDRIHLPGDVRQILALTIPPYMEVADFVKLINPEDAEKVIYAFNQALNTMNGFSIEYRIKGNDGKERYIFQQCDVIRDVNQKAKFLLGTIQDITALKRAEEMILHQAYHDALTNLPNQTFFKERLTHALKVSEHLDNNNVVIKLDIDRFKVINESLGHDTGDVLLIQLAGLLNQRVQEGDTVSRISADEFAILLEGVKSQEEVVRVVNSIRSSLAEKPFDLNGEEVHVSLSMGIAMSPEDAIKADNLVQCANKAMSRAKSNGGNQECFYSADMDKRAHDRLSMERDLRAALIKDELEIYYQPQMSIKSREIVSAEALVRWNHPQHGVVSPMRFIPLAEETGLISELGKWVIDKTVAQASCWHEQGYNMRIGVNLSAKQFMQDDLVKDIESILNKNKFAAKFLDLEITERIAMQDAANSIDKMHQLKELGVNISLDDFGTGYSSLGYLSEFPLDVLKIDQSFVRGIRGKEGDGTIAGAVIAMAKSMGLEVIAEGVESDIQFEFLKWHGCDYAQGYLISKPLSALDFIELLKQAS
ncbi:MAG: EAL domain-containing protein [Gammaproteobacteria bacterium]|nr:EAL domain-containing protein [Gammaproteobacteria bacterium]